MNMNEPKNVFFRRPVRTYWPTLVKNQLGRIETNYMLVNNSYNLGLAVGKEKQNNCFLWTSRRQKENPHKIISDLYSRRFAEMRFIFLTVRNEYSFVDWCCRVSNA